MKENRIPDLFIEKLLLDELPKHKKEELLKDPQVQRRVAELKAANQRILEVYPAGEMAQAIRLRARQSVASRAEAPPAEAPSIGAKAKAEQTRAAGDRGGILDWLRGVRSRYTAEPRRLHLGRSRLGRLQLVPVAGFALLVLVGGLLLITRGAPLISVSSLS